MTVRRRLMLDPHPATGHPYCACVLIPAVPVVEAALAAKRAEAWRLLKERLAPPARPVTFDFSNVPPRWDMGR